MGCRTQVQVAVIVMSCLAPLPAQALEEPLTCEEPALTGHVVAVKKGRVHVDLGSEDGITSGMHVAVIPKGAIKKHEKYGTTFLSGCHEEVTAIVVLDSVGEKQSSGLIGRGSAAVKGDSVVLTAMAMTHKRKFPGFPHQYLNIWDLSMRLYMLPVGDATFPIDLRISYTPRIPIKLTAYMNPSVVAAGDHASFNVGFMVSYSSRFFELGLGFGGYMDNIFPTERFSISQYLRLGVEHGMRLEIINNFVWDHGELDEDEELEGRGLRWDSFTMEAVVPLFSRLSIYLDASRGGGNTNVDWVRVTSGVHIYAMGYGGPGTIVIPIGLGGGFYEADIEDCVSDIWGECMAIEAFAVVIMTGIQARW